MKVRTNMWSEPAKIEDYRITFWLLFNIAVERSTIFHN